MRPPLFLVFSSLPFVLGQFSQVPPVSLPQCQCIPDPQAGCVQYDSRFQATTLDEAMSSFPDLTLERNETSPDPTLEQAQAMCTTQECIDCQNDLNYRLKKVGLLPLGLGEVLPPTQNLTSTCKKYKFSGNEEGVYEKDEPHALTFKADDDDSDESSEDSGEKWQKKTKKREKKHDRRKRQTVGSTVTIVGQRYTLSCSAKGIATDSTGLVSLCSTCWVWRRLPDNYSPQYINELVCDQSDGACLSGYATCGIGHRSVDVVQINGNTKTTVSISAGSFCECKVSRTSALLSLVTGNTTTTVMPLLGMPPVPGG